MRLNYICVNVCFTQTSASSYIFNSRFQNVISRYVAFLQMEIIACSLITFTLFVSSHVTASLRFSRFIRQFFIAFRWNEVFECNLMCFNYFDSFLYACTIWNQGADTEFLRYSWSLLFCLKLCQGSLKQWYLKFQKISSKLIFKGECFAEWRLLNCFLELSNCFSGSVK